MYVAFVAMITVDELHLCASSLPKQCGITQGIYFMTGIEVDVTLVVGTGY